MHGIKMIGAAATLPERVVTNADMMKIVDTSDEWIVSRTGIRERRHCTEETHTQLCTDAAKLAMERAGTSAEEIAVCIVATLSPDLLTPAAACMLQKTLGLSEDTICFDLNAACTGFLFALHTAECLLASTGRKKALVIGCEILSRLTNFEDRSTCILFGDGAGAVVIESSEQYNPTYAMLGARADERVLNAPGTNTGVPSLIHMEGQSVFKFAVEVVTKCVKGVLEKAKMTIDEVDHFALHQANERIIDTAVKRCGIPVEKAHKNISMTGNTSAASIPILLGQLWEQGVFKVGQKVMCVGFGGGLTYGGALIEVGGKI